MKALLFFFGILVSNMSYSQTPAEIQQWQNLHPGFLLMTVANFESLPSALQTKLKQKVVLFTPESEQKLTGITLEPIPNKTIDVATENRLKEWRALHPDVKLIPKSVFLAASTEQQLSYQQSNCLILAAETLTISDLPNY